MSGKKLITVAVFLITVVINPAYAAKSVFIISSHGSNTAQAYAINGDQVTLQADVDISTYNPGAGAVGIAVWPDRELMFVTYEDSPMIVWASTKTLQKVGEFNTGVSNLAGIVVDEEKEKIYIVRRYSTELYVYLWDDVNDTIVAEYPNDPNYPTREYYPLQNTTNAHGIALDETNDLLYVADYTKTVRYYDTATWSYQGSIDIVVGTNPREAVGIAVDPIRGYLYTGHWTSHNYLVRTNIATQASVEVEVTNGWYGENVLGIDVDDETGLVYCTTYHHDFRVYDSSLILKDTETNSIYGPAGVAVGGWYKSDNFNLSKDDGGVICVSPDQQFTYYIHYNANDADTSVVVTDTLPPEVDYISSSPQGQPDEHTVTWTFPYIEPGQPGTLQIQVALNCHADPGGTITNVVEMEGDNYYSKATLNTTQVCCYGGPIIYVDKDATNGCNNGTSWDDAYIDLQKALARARRCPGATAIWVAAGTYKPTTNPADSGATFELIDGVDMYGHFGGIETYEDSPDERDFANAANKTTLDGQIGVNPLDAVQYVVTAKNIGYSEDTIVDGFTITGSYNGAGVLIDDCPNSKLKIIKCNIEDNHQYGIYSIAPDGSTWHFELQDCVVISNSMYGIYCERSWPLINKTIFDGYIDEYNQSQSGISASMSAIDIYDSEVKNHTGPGIYASYSYLLAEGCSVKDNGGTGVACQWFCDVEIKQSKICLNKAAGIYLEDSLETTITNNWICDNLRVEPYDYAGIYLNGPISPALIRNNTVCKNEPYGIYLTSGGTEPEVVNCILYYNTTQIGTGSGQPLQHVTYSCIQNGYDGEGNIDSEPLFLDEDTSDYHLTWDSGCVDAGDPNGNYDGETDIDGEGRVKYGRVDIGGDEYYWSPADFNNPDSRDGLVNFIDYAIFANAWDSNTSDSDWNHDYDLAANGVINYYDLDLFCEDWLWQAGWTKTFTCGAGKGMIQTMAAGFAPAEALYPSVLVEQQIEKVEPLKIEQLIKWLEELWLDEETQKVIDKDIWLKFIESLKEEL